jgi:hypothetical protein
VIQGKAPQARAILKDAVVLYGTALKSILTNDAYRSRYKIDNPNLELIGRLRDAGVDLYICGQSMTFGGTRSKNWPNPRKSRYQQ